MKYNQQDDSMLPSDLDLYRPMPSAVPEKPIKLPSDTRESIVLPSDGGPTHQPKRK